MLLVDFFGKFLYFRGTMTTTISVIDFGNLKPLELFIGFIIAFAGCLLLMFAIKSIISSIKAKKKPAEENIVIDNSVSAPIFNGSCGELKLVNTDERTAAMIMAIVAEQTETPLNELRFVSIEKKEEDDK